ncbi:MAG TPA: TonB family protein [Thermoanaerobaculia bacterium]|nr:TonB family protein [Thermoanaerobaculia bacterium]
MSVAVDQILARRSRSASRKPEAAAVIAALLLHGAVVAGVLLAPRLAPPPEPLEFVPVTILPAQALGVRRPASRPKAETPKPPAPEPAAEEPERPAPEPEPKKPEPAKPEPKPAAEDVPTLPTRDKKPEKKPEKTPASSSGEASRKPPAPETAKKPEPAPPGRSGTGTNPAGTAAQGTPDGEAGRRGAPTGSPLGTTAFGSEIAGLDNPDFTYSYYIDQLLSAIDANWVRPSLGDGVRAIIAFRIGRDGSLSGLEVAESSGYNSFDLAALRAVQNAAPFPPLPRAYRHDSLGVRLIVR